MSYVVMARKYRPKGFDEVVGQEPIARTLKNAIASGRVAHAYLFTGPRGVGKTSMARIFAMALNCASSDGPTPEPCGACASCSAIFLGEDVDVREIDGASNNGVDDVRALRDNAGYRPAHSRFKIYVIDEVHMLSTGAFNALLKTLEEPPSHVKFIFATTDPNKLPETILSRCQRFDFRAISTEDIVKRLVQITKAEKVKASDDVLRLLARRARGGMRDSQSLLDQIVAYNPEEITTEAVDFVLGRAFDDEIDRLIESFRAGDAAAALGIVGDLVAEGQDLTEFLGQLVETVRALMVLKATKGDGKLLDLASERVERLAKLSDAFSMDSVLYMLQVVGESDRKSRTAVEKRVVVETAMVKLATMEDLRPLSEIVERLKALESSAVAKAMADKSAPAEAPPTLVGGHGPRTAAPAPRAAAPARAPQGARPFSASPAPAARPEPAREPVEEAPAEPAPEEPPLVTDSGPLGEIQSAWPRLLALLKMRKGPSFAAWMKEVRPTALSDSEITVTVSAGFGWIQQQISEPSKLEIIEQCLAEVIGRKLKVRVTGGGAPTAANPGGDATPAKPGRPSPKTEGVKRAVEMFGGRVMDEEQ